jgi:hypothetical protein
MELLKSEVYSANFPDGILSPLTDLVRSELDALPSDLTIWNQERAPPYCGGIGGMSLFLHTSQRLTDGSANIEGEHILDLISHPLRHALAYLPQSLMLIALYSRSLEATDLSHDELDDFRWRINVDGSGTIIPWGYGGHHRTLFGIHFEDAWMPSANLHIAGAPKIWIFIRRSDFNRLSDLLSRTYSHLSTHTVIYSLVPLAILHRCFPYHRSLFVHPLFLAQHKIRFTIARQAVGDMIIAGSTAAHLGWNAGPNLAVAANFLDQFSIDIILRDVMNGDVAPWPCACGNPVVPLAASIDGTTMNLPCHRYLDPAADDVGSAIFEWIHYTIPFIESSSDYLHTDPGRFARVWRYLHNLEGHRHPSLLA